MRTLLASGTIIGVPSVSLIPCIFNESREDRKQVDSIGVAGVVILETVESNGFNTHVRAHVVDVTGWQGLGVSAASKATRGEKHGSLISELDTAILGFWLVPIPN